MGRLEVTAFESIKIKYEWITNQTKCTQGYDNAVMPKDQSNDDYRGLIRISN